MKYELTLFANVASVIHKATVIIAEINFDFNYERYISIYHILAFICSEFVFN